VKRSANDADPPVVGKATSNGPAVREEQLSPISCAAPANGQAELDNRPSPEEHQGELVRRSAIEPPMAVLNAPALELCKAEPDCSSAIGQQKEELDNRPAIILHKAELDCRSAAEQAEAEHNIRSSLERRMAELKYNSASHARDMDKRENTMFSHEWLNEVAERAEGSDIVLCATPSYRHDLAAGATHGPLHKESGRECIVLVDYIDATRPALQSYVWDRGKFPRMASNRC